MKRNRKDFATRAEWLEARKLGIGASDVATVVGLNPYKTPLKLWREKLGLDAPEEENEAMRRGQYLEDAVARWWANETGREIIAASKTDFLFIDETRNYLRVSPDRTFWIPDAVRNDDNKGILECKTTMMNVDPDDIPKTWFCQVQMNLGVAGYTHGSLAWMCGNFKFGYVDIEFVPEFYQWLVDAVEKFWTFNIMQKVEPEPVNSTDVLIKYNQHVSGKIIEVGDEVLNAYNELKEIKKHIAELDGKKGELEERIKLSFGDAEAVTHDGITLATWKASKPSMKFDEKAFKAANPSEWDKYAKEVAGSRRFLLK